MVANLSVTCPDSHWPIRSALLTAVTVARTLVTQATAPIMVISPGSCAAARMAARPVRLAASVATCPPPACVFAHDKTSTRSSWTRVRVTSRKSPSLSPAAWVGS